MELQKTICDLISFRSQTGDIEKINDCLTYVKSIFENTNANIKHYQKQNIAPVILLSNHDGSDFDVLVVGHLDVVPAENNMFSPRIENGRLYGRGALDMKSFAAVGLQSLEYVLQNKLSLKFGVLLSTDEEKGSHGLESFLADNSDLQAKIVLDVDVAGDINKIITKCKNPVFVKITTKGLEAHGSTPWYGIDANEKLLQVLQNIRKIYPYFSKETTMPNNTWIDTVHFAKISGGDVANVISNYAEALLDFRLTENSTLQNLEDNLKQAMIEGAKYEIISSANPVVVDEQNSELLLYKKTAEQVLTNKIDFEYIGGATDSRHFAEKGSIVIMHSGSGNGMHAKSEYVELKSIEQLAKIQQQFLAAISRVK